MEREIKIILDFSDETQALLLQQDVNLYEELQKEIPSLRFELQPDPNAQKGRRDATTVILATASLVSALTPIIIRILNQFTPPNRSGHWEVEEIETRHPDGTVIIHRKRIRSSEEQRPWTAQPYPDTQSSTSTGQMTIPQNAQDSQQ